MRQATNKQQAPDREAPADAVAALIARARRDSAEFPPCMANHLPMILLALHRLGADERRLQAFFATYRAANGLVPIAVPAAGDIDAGNWRRHLGERAREAGYRVFFAAEVARLGPGAAQAQYLPVLAPGVAASALHALMRLAYADLGHDPAEVAVALAYWAATYLELGGADAAPTPIEDPLAILLSLRGRFEVPPQPETDLLWHWMRAVAASPGFAPAAGALAVTPQTLACLRQASLALMASTMTFEALHALTGCHWLRMVEPDCPAMPVLLRSFWTAIAAVYPKIGMPMPLGAEALEALRHAAPLPDWSAIAAEAVRRDDEHDISLVFSAREEWRLTGDRLYQMVAARRLGLA